MDRAGTIPTTTRRRFLAVAGTTAAAVAIPRPLGAFAAADDGRAPLSRAQRRTVRALLEADLPAGTPRARISAGRAEIDKRYARASSAMRQQLRRILNQLEGSPTGGKRFSALDRDGRRALLRDMGADTDPDVVDFGTAQAFADFVATETAVVATTAIAGAPESLDFAELPAGTAPEAVAWKAQLADPGAAVRADVRTALLLVRAALESLDHLDEF